MTVRQINCALESLLKLTVRDVPRGETRLVCRASQAQWDAFVESDDQVIKSKHLEWFAETNEIHIVEFPGKAHENLVFALAKVFVSQPIVDLSLGSSGASYNDQGPRREPDLSYGPNRDVAEPLGAKLPANVAAWDEFLTLKIEVGISRGWGDEAAGSLDWKALSVWKNTPGVEYTLCVSADEDLENAAYKLFDYAAEPLALLTPRPIEGPQTFVAFDPWRLLGIDAIVADSRLPLQFPDPVEIDLFAALTEARCRG